MLHLTKKEKKIIMFSVYLTPEQSIVSLFST